MNQVSYMQGYRAKAMIQGYRAKAVIQDEVRGEEKEQFKIITSLLGLLNGYTRFETEETFVARIREEEEQDVAVWDGDLEANIEANIEAVTTGEIAL